MYIRWVSEIIKIKFFTIQVALILLVAACAYAKPEAVESSTAASVDSVKAAADLSVSSTVAPLVSGGLATGVEGGLLSAVSINNEV